MQKEALTVATAQHFISTEVRENGHEIRRLMYHAHDANADLIHFPEGALSGYSKAQISDWQKVDWARLRQELEATADLAKQLGLWTVIGSNHPLGEPHRPHNSLYVISAAGELHTRYDKQWCSHTELNDWYTPGQGLGIFELKGWRFGCALCIEIQFPELFMAYAQQEVDCLLFSAYSDSAMFGIQAQAYAATHNIWFSVAVPRQMSHGLTSRMIGPDGELQTLCEAEQSTLCISTLDALDERWKVPLQYAKPWRKLARKGEIYRTRFVNDARSKNKQIV
ncbi:MAG: carbon-nitrogen hydrolase family protein [Trueperaceae bacterium]|nr:carbon-nitrogen hydrolase family protein [Trueperaceae bacterium]